MSQIIHKGRVKREICFCVCDEGKWPDWIFSWKEKGTKCICSAKGLKISIHQVSLLQSGFALQTEMIWPLMPKGFSRISVQQAMCNQKGKHMWSKATQSIKMVWHKPRPLLSQFRILFFPHVLFSAAWIVHNIDWFLFGDRILFQRSQTECAKLWAVKTVQAQLYKPKAIGNHKGGRIQLLPSELFSACCPPLAIPKKSKFFWYRMYWKKGNAEPKGGDLSEKSVLLLKREQLNCTFHSGSVVECTCSLRVLVLTRKVIVSNFIFLWKSLGQISSILQRGLQTYKGCIYMTGLDPWQMPFIKLQTFAKVWRNRPQASCIKSFCCCDPEMCEHSVLFSICLQNLLCWKSKTYHIAVLSMKTGNKK